MTVGTRVGLGLLVLACVKGVADAGTSCERVVGARSGGLADICAWAKPGGNDGVVEGLWTTGDDDAEVDVEVAAGRAVVTSPAEAGSRAPALAWQGAGELRAPMNGAVPVEGPADAGGLFEDHRNVLGRAVSGSHFLGRGIRCVGRKRAGLEQQPLASGRRQEPREGRGNWLGRFLAGLDLQGRFGFSSSAGRDATFALTTRFRRRYLFAATGERNQISFGPEVALRANSSDQDDENSIDVSAPLTITHTRGPTAVDLVGPEVSPQAPLVNAFVLNVGPALEIDKGFGRANFVPDGELGVGLTTFGGGNQDLEVWPYVGLEAGMGLTGGEDGGGVVGNVGVDAAESIARAKTGVDARYRLRLGGGWLREIVLEAEFVYRQLYTVEPLGRWVARRRKLSQESGQPGEAEDMVVVWTLERGAGKGSRRYLNAAVRFGFTENWEFVVSYASSLWQKSGFRDRHNVPDVLHSHVWRWVRPVTTGLSNRCGWCRTICREARGIRSTNG